ncbi:hypothetical protein GCM10010269_02690 [Streptomyces humidus]|uniref:Uncharacterized protein n=1 Tax=Streptomyces humidus TaxID=52259 RepID=A0A918L0P8_9ACTN|nr:hypothetical protein [Streptomyces humidus]GGR67383.1 hypothetical protein GCM10010269_02690 [Streptomyces humidus]
MPTHRTPDGTPHEYADDRPPPARGEPPEHARFAAYLEALARVPAAEETSLVRRVLTDEDATMARSAVVRHLDRTATEFPRATVADDESWQAWTKVMKEAVEEAVGEDAFLTTRLSEWTLLRALTAPSGPRARTPPTAAPVTATVAALGTASDWLQRRLVEAVDASPQALAFLAEHGRTKKVRAAAANRVR